jgi:hypothetical protein
LVVSVLCRYLPRIDAMLGDALQLAVLESLDTHQAMLPGALADPFSAASGQDARLTAAQWADEH